MGKSKGGYAYDKDRHKSIAQISILVVCFAAIALLTVFFSSMGKKKSGKDYQNPTLVQRQLPADDSKDNSREVVYHHERDERIQHSVSASEQEAEHCTYLR